MYTWQLVQVKHACDIPIILLGKTWDGFVEWIRSVPLRNGFLNKEDLDLLFPAKNATEAMTIIRAANDVYKKDKKNVCVNIRKYNIHRKNNNENQ